MEIFHKCFPVYLTRQHTCVLYGKKFSHVYCKAKSSRTAVVNLSNGSHWNTGHKKFMS